MSSTGSPPRDATTATKRVRAYANQLAVAHDRPDPGHDPRKALASAGVAVACAVGLYLLLPQVAGLEATWQRVEQGRPAWLAVGLACTVGMFAGYIMLFRSVFARGGPRLGWVASADVTLAGLAATRLLSAGGAGGIALTAWAMRGFGMPRRDVVDRTIAFLVLTYAVYMAALVIGGLGLRTGLLPGPSPFAMTVLPAALGLVAIAGGLAVALVPTDVEARLERLAAGRGRLGRLGRRAAVVPASASSGVRDAIAHVRGHDLALLGALAFWGCQIAVLWACFLAFGEAPPAAVLVLGFFVGMFGNLLPLPGGVGGVDGGMIGAFAAFGVDAGLAVVAVLVFRAFTFWLPTLPGAIAYVRLRRRLRRA